jgi:DNA repair protein RadA/Sms
MKEHGLEEVKNPSATFIGERTENPAGNVLTCVVEGTRPLIVEVQALVTKSAAGSFASSPPTIFK